jgi:serine/threonine-protein kinase
VRPPAAVSDEEVRSFVGREVVGKHHYRLEALLARGGTSSVYLAKQLRHDRAVAVKVMHAAWAAVPEMARRFEREAAAARRLAHPNVIEVLDAGAMPDGALFMVMELLDGAPLDRLLAKGPLPVPRALELVKQVLRALADAHRLGIVHRDIKPHNIFVVERDGEDVVKLFDFGIALNEKAAVKLTRAGTAFGTPEYISPEMAKGDVVDGRADLYSLGVTLFEMLTGRLPFERDDALDLLRAHINEAPPALTDVDARLPPRLAELVARCLRKEPGARFPSAKAMLAAVETLERQLGHAPRRRVALWVAIGVVVTAATLAAARLLN